MRNGYMLVPTIILRVPTGCIRDHHCWIACRGISAKFALFKALALMPSARIRTALAIYSCLDDSKLYSMGRVHATRSLACAFYLTLQIQRDTGCWLLVKRLPCFHQKNILRFLPRKIQP